ncbi:uncharacterized protein LOC119080591 [Bradysia coprophila]|uniref:uncharacterized protein LOC119080591 n=1 Tax=Bradysia coprophila TaxID=38358 RepID=UPI00187D8843|nr:uncharacterized protein LOC119080591 [Bradysia coprophila]
MLEQQCRPTKIFSASIGNEPKFKVIDKVYSFRKPKILATITMSNLDQRNILLLNDDCFYHIFKFLPIIEWCSLRETCTRFRTISDYLFKRQAETFRLLSYNFTVNEVKRVLRNFGQFIKKLSINQNYFRGDEDFNELLPYLECYCRSLSDVKFVNFNATLTMVVHREQFFSNLQRLVVDQWTDEQALACCLSDCVSLKELVLIRLTNIPGDSLAYGRIKSLESLTMNCCDDFNYDTLKTFLAKNWQLTKVKFFTLKFRNEHDADHLMDYVANTLATLEALSVHFNMIFRPNVLPVTRLASLKKFEINTMYVDECTVNQLLTNLAVHNKIEDLHLALFKCTDESLQRLLSLKSLKILKFTEMNHLDGDICKRLATQLPALSEVHIIECNDTTLNEIKQFVLHLPHLKRIVYNRVDDTLPSVTSELLLSLVETRRAQPTKDVLLIFLNDDDLSDIQNDWIEPGILAGCSYVVRLIPLDKEHRRTVFEYGSRFMRGSLYQW